MLRRLGKPVNRSVQKLHFCPSSGTFLPASGIANPSFTRNCLRRRVSQFARCLRRFTALLVIPWTWAGGGALTRRRLLQDQDPPPLPYRKCSQHPLRQNPQPPPYLCPAMKPPLKSSGHFSSPRIPPQQLAPPKLQPILLSNPILPPKPIPFILRL